MGTDRAAPGCCQGRFVSVGVSGSRQAPRWGSGDPVGDGNPKGRWASEEKRGRRGGRQDVAVGVKLFGQGVCCCPELGAVV